MSGTRTISMWLGKWGTLLPECTRLTIMTYARRSTWRILWCWGSFDPGFLLLSMFPSPCFNTQMGHSFTPTTNAPPIWSMLSPTLSYLKLDFCRLFWSNLIFTELSSTCTGWYPFPVGKRLPYFSITWPLSLKSGLSGLCSKPNSLRYWPKCWRSPIHLF